MKFHIYHAVTVFLIIISSSSGAEEFWRTKPDHCQILDKIKPAWEVGFGIIPSSRFEDSGKSSMIEMKADWEFAYFRDIGMGDIDLNLSFQDTIFTDSADLDLPGQATKIALDTGWTWRYANGVSLQSRFAPGLYSDMEDVGPNAFYFPFSFSVLRTFSPHLSGIAGFEWRHKFEMPFMPMFGVEWEINEMFRLEARIPESRLWWFVNHQWNTYVALDWQNTSYRMNDSRDKITLEDYRLYWGISWRLTDQVRLTAELGRALNRSIEFDEGRGDDTDIDSMGFLRVGITGPF